jgi:chromate transporter
MTPTTAELIRVFGRIGLLSFGGPAAQIALMHRELVTTRNWMTEAEFLRALSFCMMLPGPEAMQLATYAGWRMRGTLGGLIGGGLFVIPGALIVLGLAMTYAAFGGVPLVQAVFVGVQAAVLAIVVQALMKLARRAVIGPVQAGIALAAFIGLFFFALPFPLIVLAAGLIGFAQSPQADRPGAPPAQLSDGLRRRALHTAFLWGALWQVPLAMLGLWPGGFLFEIGLFFSQLAVVTFGGAYAVLAWMTQAVVQDKMWLTLPQMVDALGLAETTPGPLILVTEFAAYLAGHGHGKGGVGLGIAAALIALWMTFVPCFLWVFTGAPFIERLAHAPRLSASLAAITAAIVGVIANLSIWFALHVLFSSVNTVEIGPLRLFWPELASLRPLPLSLSILASLCLFWRGWPLLAVLASSAGLSLIAGLFGTP